MHDSMILDNRKCALNIVQVNEFCRISNATQKQRVSKLFSKKELDLAFKRKSPGEAFAARLACKRAINSLLQQDGYTVSVDFNKIEILNDNEGRPYVNVLASDLKGYLFGKKRKIRVSLSHTRQYGIAAVTLDNED